MELTTHGIRERVAEILSHHRQKHGPGSMKVNQPDRDATERIMALLEEGERMPDGWRVATCRCGWTGCIESDANVCPDCSAASLHPTQGRE